MARIQVDSPYLTPDQFEQVIKPLNLDLSVYEKQELMDRAAADLEAELVKRFVIPLVSVSGGAFENAQNYSRNVVVTALKSRLKSLAGIDKNRNVVVEQGQRFVDLHKQEFDGRIKLLLDPHRHYDFMLQPQAKDSIDPIQDLCVSRADDRPHRVPDFDAI